MSQTFSSPFFFRGNYNAIYVSVPLLKLTKAFEDFSISFFVVHG